GISAMIVRPSAASESRARWRRRRYICSVVASLAAANSSRIATRVATTSRIRLTSGPAADYNAEFDGTVRDISGRDALVPAYAACEAVARSHYENFPVASRLLPKAMRPHIAAIYAFARVGDDIADEGTLAAVERRARLGAWRTRLHTALDGAVDVPLDAAPPD